MLSEHTRGEGILAIHTRVRLHIYTYSITEMYNIHHKEQNYVRWKRQFDKNIK